MPPQHRLGLPFTQGPGATAKAGALTRMHSHEIANEEDLPSHDYEMLAHELAVCHFLQREDGVSELRAALRNGRECLLGQPSRACHGSPVFTRRTSRRRVGTCLGRQLWLFRDPQ